MVKARVLHELLLTLRLEATTGYRVWAGQAEHGANCWGEPAVRTGLVTDSLVRVLVRARRDLELQVVIRRDLELQVVILVLVPGHVLAVTRVLEYSSTVPVHVLVQYKRR